MNSRHFISSIDEWNGQGLLSILGPTGSGKTALAMDLLHRKFSQDLLHPLLVSVDSVAMYRELNIGSAKPQASELAAYRWAGIDLFSPSEEINARKFIEGITPALTEALQAKRPIVLLGGSFFYERALIEGMSPGEKSDPAYIATLASQSEPDLHQALVKSDARWRDKVHPNDRYRLERYSDLALRQKLGFDQLFSDKKDRPLEGLDTIPVQTLVIGMEWDRDQYLIRLEKRIHEMFQAGWFNEVKKLLEKYPVDSTPALASVGYLQIVQGLKAGRTVLQIEDDVLVSHLQLVKKQKTWIRGMQAKS